MEAKYRYTLSRTWDEGPLLYWVMLNPSTADEKKDDPTIRKCIGFSKRYGYAGLTVLNLFAVRATDPDDLPDFADPVGPENDRHFGYMVGVMNKVVVAWGVHGSRYPDRVKQVMHLLRHCDLWCLGKTKDGHPRHPLMRAYQAQLVPFP